jgi:HEAT repeat protein
MFKPDIDKMRVKRDAGGLIKALSYKKDLNIRVRAAAALGELGDRRALEPLVEVLQEVPPALATFSGFDQLTKAVVSALGQLRDPRAVTALNWVMERWNASKPYSEDVYIRKATIKALAAIATPEAIASIVRALRDPDVGVCIAASEELGRLRWQPVDDQTRQVIEALQIRTLVQQHRWDEIGDRHTLLPLEFWVEKLGSGDVETRRYAAQVLGELKAREALEPLLRRLNDSDVSVVIEVVATLGRIGDPTAIGPLLDARTRIVQSKPGYHRLSALDKKLVQALASIGEPIIDSLAGHLNERFAIEAIGEIGTHKSASCLLRLVETSQNLELVGHAGYYLGRMKEKRAVEPLCQALKQASGVDFQNMIQALGAIGEAGAVESLIEALDREIGGDRLLLRLGGHPYSLHALVNIGEPARGPLLKRLESTSYQLLREEIEWALEQIETRSANS